MATESRLVQKMTSAAPGSGNRWGPEEAAVEVLAEVVENLGVAPVNTTATPGSDATKAVSVQGVTGGKLLPVVSTRKQYAGVPSSAAILTADGTVFTLAANEIGFIQVLSADAPLAVKLGTGASTTSLHFILAAGTAASDGKAGAHMIDYWIGVVSVAKMTGTSSYLAWKVALA
jgi:hypothetical protein